MSTTESTDISKPPPQISTVKKIKQIDKITKLSETFIYQIIPILQPIAKHPIKFLNPMYMYKILKLR